MQRIVRIAIFMIVCLILVNSLVFVGLSVYRSFHAYSLIFQGKFEERPGVLIAEALDGFLIAIFLLVFSIGITKLFLPDTRFLKGYELPWLKVGTFSELKLILWEMLLTTLFVYCAASLILREGKMDWTILIIPVSILLLSLAYKFLKQGH